MREVDPLSIIQTQHRKWAEHNFGPTVEGKSTRSLLGIMEELGELCHSHLKRDQGIRGTLQQHRHAQIDAVGDIVIFLMDYCTREDINLMTAVEDTWEQVQRRDWKANPLTGVGN